MSAPKLISPLLDGFIMGEPISDHNGVRCCPAIREDTDERYIVKIVSIPASQSQLDALLLSGAFQNEHQAQDYFKDIADGICKEAATLSQLSKLEGFLPYQCSQTVKMDNGTGYDVYLLSPYRTTLEKLLHVSPPTHLSAVNLGLDMCAALAVCRRSGHMYVDLKPENIFLTEMRGYCIGDLGFIPTASMRYASLPERYRSLYTAPEVDDAYSPLSATMDIYALGLVLYQIYNNGELPFEARPPVQTPPPPMYADYEMAQIILKACAPDPADRWKDPVQMGQALVDYMQRNEVNDVPIIPVPDEPAVPIEEEPETFLTEEENEEELADLLAMIPDEVPPVDDPTSVPDGASSEEKTAKEHDPDDATSEDAPQGPEAEEAAEEAAQTDENDEVTDDTVDIADDVEAASDAEASDIVSAQEEATEEATEAPPDDASEPDQTEESVIVEDALPSDDEEETPPLPAEEDPSDSEATAPAAEYPRTEVNEDGVTVEVAEMLAQADELLLMELPDPVVAPDPIDVPIPPPIVLEVPEEPIPETMVEPEAEAESETIVPEETGDDAPEVTEETPMTDETPTPPPERKKRKLGAVIGIAVALVLVALLAFGAYRFYQDYYLQTVDSFTITGTEDELTVLIQSDIDESLLTAVCTDTYGNTLRAQMTDGKAVFSQLNPNTQYTVHLEIDGYHKLKGTTTGSYTTAAQTQILNLSAVMGSEDGTVELSFATTGPVCDRWKVEYSTSGEDMETFHFTGKRVSLGGLTVGKEYTFRILPEDDVYFAGTNEIRYTPRTIVCAQDLTAESYLDGVLTVTWGVPEGAEGQRWIVRCYNDAGFDVTLPTSTDTTVVFLDLDPSIGHTVTVTAEGMPKSVSVEVTADPINVTGFQPHWDPQTPWLLTLDWTFTGKAPASGWIVTYTADGEEPMEVETPEASVSLALRPGCTYDIQVRSADDTTCFCDGYVYGPVEIDTFEDFFVTAADMSFTMFVTPDTPGWGVDNLTESTTTFHLGTSACLLMQLSSSYEESQDYVRTTFVILDESGKLVSTESSTRTWDDMWHKRKGTVQIPQMPDETGSYTVDIYMDGQYVATLTFTVI